MKLHLCCGDNYLYTHDNYDVAGKIVSTPPIDARTLDNYYSNRTVGDRRPIYVDGHLNLLDMPWKWEDNSVEEVLLISAIEHFTLKQATSIVGEIYRILQHGGRFISDFPDIQETVNQYKNDTEFMMRHIYGSYKDQWATHKWGYTVVSYMNMLGVNRWKFAVWKNFVTHDYPTIGCCVEKI
jgi:hypothetical protein